MIDRFLPQARGRDSRDEKTEQSNGRIGIRLPGPASLIDGRTGVDQVTVLVGTVIRAKPHDGTLARGGPYLLAASN